MAQALTQTSQAESVTPWHLTAELLVNAATLYVAVGLLFAILYASFGAPRLDPAAEKGTWGFRLLSIPGTVALWPLLAWRWLRREGPPIEDNAHRRAARSGGGSNS